MTGPGGLRVVTLEGTPRERGRIHGESLRAEIAEVLGRASESWLYPLSGEMSPLEYLKGLVQKTELPAAAQRWAPDLVEEVRGVAEGANVDSETLLAWHFGEELGWLVEYGRALDDPPAVNQCSVLGVFGEGGRPALLAQTADSWPGFDGLQTILHIKYPASSLELLTFTYPGWIGVYGLNNQGVGLCINSLSSRMNYAPDGLGAAFVARGILAQSSLEDAARFIQGVKHATGDAYTIGGPDKVVTYECAPNAVRQFVPYAGASRVYHTNHPLVNDDVRLTPEALVKLPPEMQAQARTAQINTETRFSTLESRLSDTSEPVTVETVKAILSYHEPPEHPICRHKQADKQVMTVGCLIMVLSDAPELHVAPGPPCMTGFETFRF